MPIDYGTNNVNTSGSITAASGNFTNLSINNTSVSISGHNHTVSDITNFNSSVSGLVSGIYAPLVSPALTGTPLAPTAPSGTNTNQIATTSFVRTEISNLVDSAPSTLDTLNELAAALGDDPNFATTVTNNLATKVSATGTTNYIPKFSGSQTIANSIIYESGNNIGIGTVSPNAKLEVDGDAYASNILSSGYLISNYFLSINDFDGGTPGSIAIGEFTSLDQMFWSINQSGSGNFSALGVNDVSVSLEGHTHTSNAITDFNSSVSGLLPTIANSGDNRVLTSTGSVNGINGESNLTFNGNLLSVTGSGLISEDLRLGALKAYRWDGNAWGYDRIVFRADVNNKITSDANGNYNWLVAAKNWTLSDAARVGIRTISPSSIMHIEGSVTDNASLLITGGAANNRVYLGNGNSDTIPFLASVASNDLTNSVYGWGIFDRNTDGDFRISRKAGSTAWTSVIHAQRLTGNIGIGTGTQATSPPERLVVDGNLRLADTAGSTGNRLQLFRGGGEAYDYTLSKEGNHLAISTASDSGTNRFTQFGYHTGSTWTPKTVINNFNGFIGVNTLSPSAALVVASTGNSNINLANFTNTDGTTRAAISLSSAGDGVFSLIDASNNTDILFSSNTGTSSYINAGRFGINTTTPSGALHIVGTGIVSSISGIAPNAMWHVYSSGSGDTVLNVEGTNGSLFAVVDNLSGSLMSVNNNAGLPVFEVFSDDRIVGGRFGQNDWVISSGGSVGIGTGIPSSKLHVIGSGNFTGSISASGNVIGLNLVSNNSVGSEGGEIQLAKPASGSSISGASVNIDIFNNTLRIFEGGSPNRGYYLDITQGSSGAGTSLRNKTLTSFTALDNQPPASGFATLDTRNSVAVLDFDDTVSESGMFVGIIPENASLASGIDVRLHWSATTDTTGICRWGVKFEKMTSDLDIDSFDAAITEGGSTTNATNGVPTVTEIRCTGIDSLISGNLFRLLIYRDSTDTVNDTMTGDAELIGIELRSVI